jgi:ABC transporter substrate binding protein (PQQ-dependent alcohol dehydrogenase system)
MRALIFSAMALFAITTSAGAAELTLDILYLRQEQERPPVLSNLDPIPEDVGEQGAALAVADSMTTGKFLGHTYTLETLSVPPAGDIITAASSALSQHKLVLLDMPAAQQNQIADLPQAQDAILFNIAEPSTDLRDGACRRNLLHTLPSDAMRTDALMQFAVKKRWTKLAMIEGDHPADHAFAKALDRSAQKFGLKIKGRKTWVFDADMRRNAAQEVPLFTQDFGDYDLLLVADELNDFGRYIPFNTWRPRPVAGSVSLVPVAWDRVVEQWGAVQMQNRFRELAGRDMRPVDYAAWAAVRTISEAATRTSSDSPATLYDYILSDKFQLAGFKGRPLSYRPWNGQLRQTIPLVSGDAMVAQAPLEGFLHQRSELDTLGLDQPESTCEAFR